MGSKKCFNAKKFFFLFFPEYLPLILGVPINVGVPNPNFRGNPPSTTFFYFMKIPDFFFFIEPFPNWLTFKEWNSRVFYKIIELFIDFYEFLEPSIWSFRTI